MKKLILAAITIAAATSFCSAQQVSNRKSRSGTLPRPVAGAPVPPQPSVTPPPPPPDGDRRKVGIPAPPPPQALQEVNVFTGRVLELAANDDYVYDRFRMLSDGDSMTVKFPPHLGKQVISMVQEGATVSVSGAAEKSPTGETELRMISITAGGKTLKDDMQPPAAGTPLKESAVSGSGKIASLQKDHEGRVNGFVLDNGVILRIGPGLELDHISGNGDVSYTGVQHLRNEHEAVARDYKIVHCRTIKINGKHYNM